MGIQLIIVFLRCSLPIVDLRSSTELKESTKSSDSLCLRSCAVRNTMDELSRKIGTSIGYFHNADAVAATFASRALFNLLNHHEVSSGVRIAVTMTEAET